MDYTLDELRDRFRELAEGEHDAFFRARLDTAYIRAKQAGHDPKRLHYEALHGVYGRELPPIRKGVVLNGSETETYVCEACGRSFPSQKALSGHGPTRCPGKKL